MRVLLDTHAFIWLHDGDERISHATRAIVDGAEEVHLSLASVWEAEIKRARGRLEAPPMAEAARRVDVPLVAITAEHVTTAAHLPRHHGDPFDRLLVAQAQLEGLVLISKDAVMRRYGIAVAW